VLAVYEATKFAVERARRGHGVQFVEVKTYRRKGHAEHDDQHYVSKDELDWWAKENDPVDRYVKQLVQHEWAEERELKAIDDGVKVEIDQATDACIDEPLPPGESALGVCTPTHRAAPRQLVPHPLMAEITYLEALRQGLWRRWSRSQRLHPGGDVGAYGGAFKVTEGFAQKFGEARVIDTPIFGGGDRGAAAGAATWGCGPVGRDAIHRLHLLRVRHAHELTSPPRAIARSRDPDRWCAARAAGTCGVPVPFAEPKRPSFTRRALKIVIPHRAGRERLIKARSGTRTR